MAALHSHKPNAHAEAAKGIPITALLHDDHLAVSALFNAIESAKTAGERFSLVQQLVRELKLHSQAEEDIFYERLEQEHAARRRMNESRDDHSDIDLQLDRLARLDGEDDRLLLLVQDLKTDVDRHVQREEEEVFASADAFLDAGEAESLGQAFLARKKILVGGGGAEADADVDDAELAHAPQVGVPPVSLQTSADLDPGFEDRGVGSDGSSPQTASTKPPSASRAPGSKATPSQPASSGSKPTFQGSKVQAATAHLPHLHGKGFEGQNAGGRHGARSQGENHLSRAGSTPRVHDGRGKRGPENDR